MAEPDPTEPAAGEPIHDPDPTQAHTWASLGEAVARITARFHGLDDPGPSGAIPPEDMITTLAVISVALLKGLLPTDRATGLLQAFGTEAATPTSPDQP